MPKKKKPLEDFSLPPDKSDLDHFRVLVQKCIEAYEESNNDSLALDFCEVSDKRLRSLILDDEEYKRKTKSIYARQRLEEVRELKYLASLAANGGGDSEAAKGGGEDRAEYLHPSERGGKKALKKSVAVDRDMLNMRFKAAQMIRELRKDMADAAGDTERDTVHLVFVPEAREDFDKALTVELCRGSDDADINALVRAQEDVPEGAGGKLRAKGRSIKAVAGGEGFFDVLPGGEVVEKDY